MPVVIDHTHTSRVRTARDKDQQEQFTHLVVLWEDAAPVLFNSTNADDRARLLDSVALVTGGELTTVVRKSEIRDESGPLGLPGAGGSTSTSAAKKGLILALDKDENVIPGTVFASITAAADAGWTIIKMDPDTGEFKGVQKPDKSEPPKPTSRLDEQVALVDKEGKDTGNRITRRKALAERKKYVAYENDAGDFVGYIKLGALGVR